MVLCVVVRGGDILSSLFLYLSLTFSLSILLLYFLFVIFAVDLIKKEF